MISLSAGDYRATVSRTGAALVGLTHRGRDLVLHDAGDPLVPLYRGSVLVPWPNRIADGAYRYGGVTHQLPINDVEHRCALHGLLLWTTWTVGRATSSEITLRATVMPQPGYPWALDTEVRYALSADGGLLVRVATVNAGVEPAPYGVSIHPYLVAGAGTVDDWTLTLQADHVLAVDPSRLLPVGPRDVGGSSFDFRAGARIGSQPIDHAFGSIAFDDAGLARAELRAANGAGVAMDWDRTCGWVQLHTTDLPGRPLHRSALAAEPMTCPPDAFNSGTDLIHLEPTQRHEAWWRITALHAVT